MSVPLVCDYGSGCSKVGFSGREAPLAVFPTILGKLRHDVSDMASAPGCCSAWRWPDSPVPLPTAEADPESWGGPGAVHGATGLGPVRRSGRPAPERLLPRAWESPSVPISNCFSGDGDAPKPGAALREP